VLGSRFEAERGANFNADPHHGAIVASILRARKQHQNSRKNSADEKRSQMIGRPFVKGQSGNARGRPRGARNIPALKRLAQQYTPEAWAELISLMRDKKTPASIRLDCIREVFNRGFGRPNLMDGSPEPAPILQDNRATNILTHGAITPTITRENAQSFYDRTIRGEITDCRTR